MNLDNWLYYLKKLFLNSPIYKAISASFVIFVSICTPEQYILVHMLIRLWVLSMFFGIINWTIKNGFNYRKMLEWFVKLITYGVLLYFALSLDLVMNINIWSLWFTGAMIFELLLSVMKHASELWIPMPTMLIRFVSKQEKEFEDKFLWGKKKL